MKNWYVLQSKPQKEDALCEQLLARRLEVFYPCVRVKPVNPRSRKLRAYFPGYVFANLALEEVGVTSIQRVPYLQRLVCFGEEPAVVPEALVGEIRRRVEALSLAAVPQVLRQGDRVVIQSGPLAGYEAIFDARLNDSERVRVLLECLSRRQVPLEVDVEQLRKIG
jgi:transcriptional antiterminator RfaH